MQTPKIPGVPPAVKASVASGARETASAITNAAGALKSGNLLPNVAKPAILLPPGVKVPARTISGLVPAKIRDLARYGVLAQQRVNAASRSHEPLKPQPLPNKPVTASPLPPRTKPIFDRSPSGKPAFQTPSTTTGEGADITRGTLSALDDIGDIMTFEYNPEEITVSHAGGWIITDQPGRAHPFIQFGGGGQRRISFTLRMFYTHNEVGDVLQNVNWLHSFLVGRERGDGIPGAPRYLHAPKTLRLKMGRMFDSVPCILISAPATYKMLFRPDSLLPLYAEVGIELLEIGGPGSASTYGERRANAMTLADNAQGKRVLPRLRDNV